MCEDCGCGDPTKPRLINMDNMLEHHHQNEHDHDHPHPHEPLKHVLNIEQDVLQKNQMFAERNRGYFEAMELFVINLVSSPGSGKTTLVEAIIKHSGPKRIYIVEGDQQGTLDASRIHKLGVPVIQINTGKSCHLEADTVGQAIRQLKPAKGALVIIENVGNLMCPSLFDLGEHYRIVLLSTPEGDDKPLKYPNMFHTSQVCIISKIDLLSYTGFSIERGCKNAMLVSPGIEMIEVSAITGQGMDILFKWLEEKRTSFSK